MVYGYQTRSFTTPEKRSHFYPTAIKTICKKGSLFVFYKCVKFFLGGGLPLELLLWLHRLAAMILASHARNRRSIPLGLLLLHSGQKKTAPKQKFRCGFKKCFLFSSQGEVSFSFTSSNCYFLRRFTHIRLPCGNFVFTGWKAINLESTISSSD